MTVGGMTAEAQVAKKPYKNQTAGWLGVVKLDHLGAQVGVGVEPYGTVYLSEEEAILTARAPRDAKDNPFVEQIFQFQDEHGQVVQKPMRPLVLITEDREVPSDERFVPGVATEVDAGVSEATVVANRRTADEALAGDSDREVPESPSEPILVPSSSAAVPPSHTRPGAPDTSSPAPPEEDQRASWVENPSRTAEPQPGSLAGSDQSVGAPEEDAARDGTPTAQPTQAPAAQPVATSTVEEHAGVTDKGEETGAADTPVGDPPEGEFASHEEVGSPEAPNQREA